MEEKCFEEGFMQRSPTKLVKIDVRNVHVRRMHEIKDNILLKIEQFNILPPS